MLASQKLYVSLPNSAAEALRDLSRREFRHPRDQATKLLVDGLRSIGALPSEQAEPHRADQAATVAAAN